MELPRERLLSRAVEVNECIAQKDWSAHVNRWLDARAAHHAHITGHRYSPDVLYTTQVDSSELILRHKMEYEVDMRTHSGSRTLTYTRFKREYILEDYPSSMANCQLRKH